MDSSKDPNPQIIGPSIKAKEMETDGCVDAF
jgi:hypothetical protein